MSIPWSTRVIWVVPRLGSVPYCQYITFSFCLWKTHFKYPIRICIPNWIPRSCLVVSRDAFYQASPYRHPNAFLYFNFVEFCATQRHTLSLCKVIYVSQFVNSVVLLVCCARIQLICYQVKKRLTDDWCWMLIFKQQKLKWI